MEESPFFILKSSGEKAKFSLEKLRNSLKHSGADDNLVQQIVNIVRDELYQGISTKEIYNRAFALLKKKKSVFASKYKLKKAIYELGPTGFPFEKLVAAILEYSGYETEVGKIMPGICVSQEVTAYLCVIRIILAGQKFFPAPEDLSGNPAFLFQSIP